MVFIRVNLLPFNIDQLIGSSSDELTAVLHWHNVGPAFDNTLIFNIEPLYLLVASIVCVAAVLVSHSLFNGYLDTTPVNTVNPVKLIIRVLCYARKHKYPENRSALTYWEEEAPSRLDLGKDKYGGPFTEEEVEDVKTVLRLIPLVVVCTMSSAFFGISTEGLRWENYGCDYPMTSIVCVTAILVSHNLFNGYLDTTPVNTVNPVKLIVRVLCYARKHKYPENRSALTYWEEEAPSRLDLGKDKYGGPFTEEEVEDVKTVLRLIPLVVVCTVASSVFYGESTEGLNLQIYTCNGIDSLQLSFSLPYILIIFLHQFLIYPCFHKYIPSMLKRIGMGLVLIVFLNILYTGLAVIGNYQFGQMFHCLTSYDRHSSTNNHQWLIFIFIINASIWYVFNVVLVEFILAQCPKSMRGSLIGLWFCLWNLRALIKVAIFLPFLHYMSPESSLGRGFYYFLARSILVSLCLILFLILAKRYKLRVREVEINIHQIAENHTINNIEHEEEYWRRNAIESSSQSIDIITSEY
uniref:Uncharacterized protein n=1 Tax=Amphimedon queenslandica TaxID=400682 RepID=A0A1X7UJQ4_AMPQE